MAIARTAGALYLVIFVCGIFSEVFVRERLIVAGDPSATAANVVASESLFRAAFVSDLVMTLSDVAVAVLLFVLLAPVSRTLAAVAASFRLVHAAVLGANLLNHLGAILILNRARDGAGEAFTAGQLDGLAWGSLEFHKYGYFVGLAFFAVHLAVLAVLVARATYLPRALGVLLGLAAAGYLADSLSFFLVSGYGGGLSPVLLAPAVVAELAIIVWLLVKGVDRQRWQTQAGTVAPALSIR